MDEIVIRETPNDFIGGFQIGSRKITNLRYVDGIVLIAQSVNKVQEFVTKLDTVSRNKYDWNININKSKAMATDGIPCCIPTQNSQLK